MYIVVALQNCVLIRAIYELDWFLIAAEKHEELVVKHWESGRGIHYAMFVGFF